MHYFKASAISDPAGLVHIPLSVVAIFVGGATMRRLDLSHLGAVKWCTLAMLLTLLCSAPLLFIGCPTHHVADVFPPSRYSTATLHRRSTHSSPLSPS